MNFFAQNVMSALYILKAIKFALLFTILLSIPPCTAQELESDDYHSTRFIWNYRTVNWCVTGRDEPGLHKWPFNQFIPIIRRTNRFVDSTDEFRYYLKFREITTHQTDVGRRGGLFKSIHVIFNAEKRSNRSLSVYEKWEPFPLEGLLIQANHNPETLGLPTGQFFEMDGPVVCQDCNATFWGIPLPCRKRAPIEAVVSKITQIEGFFTKFAKNVIM